MEILPNSGKQQLPLPTSQKDKTENSHKWNISPENAGRNIPLPPLPSNADSGISDSENIRFCQPIAGDAVFFIEDDTRRQQVLEDCRNRKHGPVITLRSPADLDHHNLLQTVICSDEGHCNLSPGRLYGEQPVTLVLDLTGMTPGQIASMNDLLAQPRSLHGKPLGASVRVIALVSPTMLEPGPEKPGPDCWRRLQAFPALFFASDRFRQNSLGKTASVKSNDALLQERISGFHKSTTHSARLEDTPGQLPVSPAEKVIIDFGDGSSWRTLLFGGLTLNDCGKLCFRPGQLAGPGETRRVILRDAPWDDPDFVAALATLLREGGFEANDARVSLPDSLEWCREDTPSQAVEELRQKFRQQWCHQPLPSGTTAPDRFVCLNPASLEDALCDTRIENGVICFKDTLKNLLSDCQAMYITGSLTNDQWLRLLRRLERLDAPPQLIDLTREEAGSGPVLQAGIQCQVYSHEVMALTGIGSTKTCRLTAQTQWSSLWQDTRMVSQNDMRFETRDTELLQALKQGKPVTFHGLETCPALVARLESLLAHPPCLFINGQKVELPEARVTFLWPEPSKQTGQPESPLWQNALRQASLSPRPKVKQNPLMALLQSLPPSTRKRYPGKSPWQALDFNALLEAQVNQERLEDGAGQTLPIHYRKALHTLLVKAYRGDDEVYGYLKVKVRQLYPDQPPETAADGDALRQWLSLHPRVDRRLLKQHFWTLVRHCPVSYFAGLLPEGFQPPGEEALDLLASYLVGATEEGQSKTLALSLCVKPQESPKHQYYHGSRRTRLRDALMAAGSSRKGRDAISEQVRVLNQRIGGIIAQCDPEQTLALTTRALTDYFPEDLLEGDFSDLAKALVQGNKGQRERQQRRIHRLAERVRKHPLVFLQGEAGAGKSHMARVVADQLRLRSDGILMPSSQVLSLGPETSAEQLFGQQVLYEHSQGDAASEFVPGPVLRWAMNDNPPILVLDEANLAREGVLAPLAGLMETPPRISYQGQDYFLNDRHRVILTGNPDHYDGRHMDSAIKNSMLTLYYRPLDQDTLVECLIRPALPGHWPESLKDQGARAMLCLYRHYGELLHDALSPRDLLDVLSRISQTLRHHHHGGAEETMDTGQLQDYPGPEQLNHLVFDAFSDSLGGRIPADNGDRVRALEQWYRVHFPGDASLAQNRQEAFRTFLAQLRRDNPQVDLQSVPVVNLVRQYWQFLDQQQDQPRGRRSLLVEGPAGWGKDLVLDCVLRLWERQRPASAPFVHINASPGQWDNLVKTTRTAMTQGQKLVISELNLLPSCYLEGLFNEVLTSGTAHPDFVLFATVNPGSFDGRENLSTAMKSRCTQVQLEPLSEPDMKGLLCRRTPDPSLPGWLSRRYHALSEQLRQHNAPIQLSLDDLFCAADTLGRTSPQAWSRAFEATFVLALKSIGLSMEALEQRLTGLSETMDDGRGAREEQLSLTLNKEQPEPLSVRLLEADGNPAWDAGRRTLLLPDTTNEAGLLDMAHCILDLYSQPVAEPVFPGGLGGNIITTSSHYYITRFFAGEWFNINEYRLILKQLVIRKDQLQEEILSCDQGGVENIPYPGWPVHRITLTGAQQLGSGDFFLKQDNWTPLPGLSALDQLVYLQCRSKQPLEVARGKETGQLLVRLASNATVPSCQDHLDFIVEPDQTSLAPLQEGETIQIVDGLCDPLVQTRLGEELFSTKSRFYPACRELQNIQKIPDMALRLISLAQWCRTLANDHDVAGQGLDLILNLIREKQGVCRHRSQVFQIVSQYFGVPVRMVSNDAHQYVEFSPDGGRCWRKIDLGGGVFTYSECSGHHSENVHLPAVSGLSIQEDSSKWREKLEELCQKGEVTKKWSELVLFLHSGFPQCNRSMRKCLRDEYPQSCSFLIDPPWPEILEHWYSLARAERDPVRQAHMIGKVGVEAIEIMKRIYDKWSLGEISDSVYFDTQSQYLPMIRRGVFSVGGVLAILESLAGFNIRGNEVEQLLEDHYQQLTRPLAWPGIMGQLLDLEQQVSYPDLGGHSPTLARALQRTTVGREWSAMVTGAPPNLERMASRQPAFPQSFEKSLTRPVIFCLPIDGELFHELIGDFVTNKIKPSSDDAFNCQDFIAFMSFSWLFWLLQQDSNKDWRSLCNDGYYCNNENIKDGCYPSVRLLSPSIDFCREFVSNLHQSHPSLFVNQVHNLNPERVKKAFGEPDALVLTDDFLAICCKEYLETIDRKKFVEFVHYQIGLRRRY